MGVGGGAVDRFKGTGTKLSNKPRFGELHTFSFDSLWILVFSFPESEQQLDSDSRSLLFNMGTKKKKKIKMIHTMH